MDHKLVLENSPYASTMKIKGTRNYFFIPFIHSFIDSFIHRFVLSIVYSFIHSFVTSFIYCEFGAPVCVCMCVGVFLSSFQKCGERVVCIREKLGREVLGRTSIIAVLYTFIYFCTLSHSSILYHTVLYSVIQFCTLQHSL